MKNPTKAQMQVVIDTMEIADKMAKKAGLGRENVDMMAVRVDNECGTPMCFAGWYLAVKNIKSSFMTGTKLIAFDLGFEEGEYLENWALENPEIWGNKHGDAIFCDIKAFGARSRQISIRTIINHLKKVQSRLPTR